MSEIVEKLPHKILHDYLIAVSVGSCTCGVKSHEVHWHFPNCPYTIFAQALDHSDAVAEEITALEARVKELEGALKGMVDMYVGMVNSGDCGFWDPEKEDEVKAARAALTPGQ